MDRQLRSFAFTFTFAFAFACAPAWAEGRAGYGGAAQGALASAPVSLDPLSPALGDLELAELIFDTPFRIDAAGQPRAHLAVSLDPPPPAPPHADGLTTAYRARLRVRTDVKFHDGTPLRAADVAASLNRAVKDPRGWSLGPIVRARALGDEVVELELSRPAPDLAWLLSTPAAAVTPNGAAVSALGPRPAGSGPFLVAATTLGPDGASVSLKANAACFAGRPYLDALTLRAFGSRTEEAQSYEAGALQGSRQGSGAFPGAARRAGTLAEGPLTLTGYLAFGRTLTDEVAGPLKDALSVGIDRERLRQKVRETSRAAAGAIPPALGGAEARPPYDASGARAQLEQRFPGRLKVTLLIDRSRFDDRALAERLLAELARLGVDVTIEALDAASYQRRFSAGAYELALGVSAPPVPDGALAELALLAAVDPSAARAQLARAPAVAGSFTASPRLLPLYHRASRLQHVPDLRGLRLDSSGRASWPDAHWLKPR